MPLSRAAISAALLLAACSGAGAGSGQVADDAGDTTVDTPAGVTADRIGVPANFNVLDACSLLDRKIVAEVMGSPVTSATLGDQVIAPTSDTAGFSNCSYKLENGLTPQFFARWSPEPDAKDPAAIVKESADAMSGTVEAVPGMKEPAYWVAGPNQLHLFPDKQRYVFFTMMFFAAKPPVSSEQAKAWAVAMAKRAGY